MLCKATRLAATATGDADWDSAPWQGIPAVMLGNHMGDHPDHFPRTEVKTAYDDSAVYVMFRVDDQYVRAAAQNHQDHVSEDSCVEFFFTPCPDVSRHYFNLEMNCGGTMLFHFQPEPWKGQIKIPIADCNGVQISHSLPRIIDPEIEGPVTWTVQCRIPIALLERYCKVTRPAPHAAWRANFYKCADGASHPHWLTWAPVDHPKPDFHRPQSFGALEFE